MYGAISRVVASLLARIPASAKASVLAAVQKAGVKGVESIQSLTKAVKDNPSIAILTATAMTELGFDVANSFSDDEKDHPVVQNLVQRLVGLSASSIKVIDGDSELVIDANLAQLTDLKKIVGWARSVYGSPAQIRYHHQMVRAFSELSPLSLEKGLSLFWEQ